MTPDPRIMRFWSRLGQPPKPNYYSSKACECCGTYHGQCHLKIQYWNVMEELEYYPEDISDFECDGCKKFKEDKMRIENNTAPYIFIFEGQNPKIDCPHFLTCQYCQGTGVYSNQLLENLGRIQINISETAEDEADYFDINTAIWYYWHRNKPKTKMICEFDGYLVDAWNCPFCKGKYILEDPIEKILVDHFVNDFIGFELFEEGSQDLTALRLWKNMKYTKRYFSSDLRGV